MTSVEELMETLRQNVKKERENSISQSVDEKGHTATEKFRKY